MPRDKAEPELTEARIKRYLAGLEDVGHPLPDRIVLTPRDFKTLFPRGGERTGENKLHYGNRIISVYADKNAAPGKIHASFPIDGGFDDTMEEEKFGTTGPKPRLYCSFETLSTILTHLKATEEKVMSAKRHDYTGNSRNQIINFVTVAEMLGMDPMQVWATYFFKHVSSVLTYAKTGKVESEPLDQRMIDIRNYCLLGLCIAEAKGDWSLDSSST